MTSHPRGAFHFPSPREAVGRDGEYRVSDMSQGGGILGSKESPPTPPRALRAGGRGIEIRSRGASSRPKPWHVTHLKRHHRFHSVLHGKLQQANAGGSIGRRRFGMDDGKNERKDSEAKRRQTQLVFCRADGRSRAWSARRTSIGVPPRRLVPRSLSSQGTQPQARLPGTWRGHVLRILLSGRYPPLPVPVQRKHLALRS